MDEMTPASGAGELKLYYHFLLMVLPCTAYQTQSCLPGKDLGNYKQLPLFNPIKANGPGYPKVSVKSLLLAVIETALEPTRKPRK